ncbi:substrate-binding domain-containing protein [Halegenticoccus tardaugens]|uniref:substrate-binding domain-containing protein n=1 Tax=Halegenticoccus tardaugens TaxID=2071624 RepID=UPI00100B02D6|nr:substrate-binding domain-containing protein [Halegenticoccus tardaugens]
MPIQRRKLLAIVGGGTAAGLAGCSGILGDEGSNGNKTGSGSSGSSAEIQSEELVLTTTTSTYDTGLLDEINAGFKNRFGTRVKAIAQGTGQALQTARNGDADVIMVHSRSQEDEFLNQGHGINRRDLMFNDFVIVGPPDDPAGIKGMKDATKAFATIAKSQETFASRGDDSGTHSAELEIWAKSGIKPGGKWYLETGQGMGETLNQASQQGAYTLSDRGTFISQQNQLELEILIQGPIKGGPKILENPYGIIAANPAVHKNSNYDLAMAYIGFVTGQEGQKIIKNYKLNGKQLFFPQALSKDPNYQQYVPAGWQPSGDAGKTNDTTDT